MAMTNAFAGKPAYYGSQGMPYPYGGYGAPSAMPVYPPAFPQPPGAAGMAAPGGVPAGPAVVPPPVPSGAYVTPTGTAIVQVPQEESYIENILRLNRGKIATAYMTYENNPQWNAKIFKGRIEAAGRDHLILSDPATGMRFLLLTVNLDYVTFSEPIEYEYPFQGVVVTSTTPIAGGAGGR